MAHESQTRYSSLVLAKIRQELVLKDGVIFNKDYEGSPSAGIVKIPVRDTEVAVSDYDRANGIKAGTSSTTYENFNITKDKAVNEVIDKYDAQTVPDNLVADRLDSAGYSLAKQEDTDGASVLIAGATPMNIGVLSEDNIYSVIVDIRKEMSKANIPNDGKRYLLVTPDTLSFILKSPEFIKASSLGDAVVQTGAVGKIAGFNVIEWNDSTANLAMIAGHPRFATRADEFSVPVHIQDLSGSGSYIGASAVQGRFVYDHKVLMQTQNNGITTVGELSSCLANVTPTAAALGVEFDQVGAALATMTAAGTPAAQATTQLNALFNELGQTGSRADLALRQLTATVPAATEEQLSAMQAGFDKEYSAAQDAYSAHEKAYSKSLDKQKDALSDSYDDRIDNLSKSLDNELEAFEKMQEKEADALDKALEAEMDALEDAHNQKLALIDNEYTEKLKLIDEERYNAIKAVEDDIDALNAKTEAERKSAEQAENAEKLKSLKDKASKATDPEERKAAEKEVADFKAKLAQKKREDERKAQIESLKGKKENLKKEYDDKKDALKEEEETAKKAENEKYKEAKNALSAEQKAKKDAHKEEQTQKLKALKEEQSEKLKALQCEKQQALDNIKEINEASLDAFKKANRERLAELKKSQKEQLEAVKKGSDDGKGFSDLLAEGMTYQQVLEMLGEYAQNVGLTLSDMFGSAEAGKAALAVTGKNADKFNSNLEAMNTDGDVVGEAYDKIANTTAERFNKLLNTLKNDAVEVFNSIRDKIGELFSDENIEKIQRLIDPIKGLVENILPPVMDILLDLIDPVAQLVEQLLPVIETLLESCADIIAELAEPLTDIINEVLPILTEILDALAKPLLELIQRLLPPIVELLDTISPLIDALAPIIEWLADVISNDLSVALEVIMPIFDVLSDCVSYLIETLKNLIDFIVGVFTGDWEKAWGAIVDQFKNIFGTILKIAEDVVNGIINCVNKIIDGINSVSGVVGIELEKWDNVDFTPDDPDTGGKGSDDQDGSTPGYAFGKDFIPEDDFPARLHRGEAVLSASDAEAFRKLGGKGSLEHIAAEPMGGGASEQLSSVLGKLAESSTTGEKNYTFNQYNTSPKALSRADIARETRRQLELTNML